MQMNPTEVLKHEHRAIEGALRILDTIARRLQEPGVSRDARQLVDFFRTFADTCHHGKEEQVLFPALEEIGVPRLGGPIEVMLAEHAQGRRHIQAMLDALDALAAGGAEQADQFREHAQSYARLLRNHIDKEDKVLFSIAEQRLTAGRQDRINEEFERIEREVVGAGKHEELHRLLDALDGKYAHGAD
jgi:hemerythrin-like domain-containing protein